MHLHTPQHPKIKEFLYFSFETFIIYNWYKKQICVIGDVISLNYAVIKLCKFSPLRHRLLKN